MNDRRQSNPNVPEPGRKRPAAPPGQGPTKPTCTGAEEPSEPTPSGVLRAFLRLRQRLARVDTDVADLTGDALLLYDRLRRALRGLAGTPVEPADASATPSPDALQWLARSGTNAVGFSWRPDGAADVSVDGYPLMHALSRKLAILLDLLQENWGQATDDKVGWKSKEALMEAMAKRTAEPFSQSALTTAINRLGNALVVARGNRYLLQSNRHLGYRFARKLPPQAATAAG